MTLDSGRLNLTVSLGGQTVSALGAPLGTGFVSQEDILALSVVMEFILFNGHGLVLVLQKR